MTQNTMTFTYLKSSEKKASIEPPPRAPRVPASVSALQQPGTELEICQLSLPNRHYEEALQELDKMIGLGTIKSSIHELAHYTAVQQFRRKQGYKTPSMSMHMAFLGNPGTGKTTVARLLARLYHRIGILKDEKFHEVSRVDLVGNYVGHTAKDTLAVLEQAKGGILFIDEAYALVRENPNDFGMEAVETLLKYMEDHRDEIIVIFAGYREPMLNFLGSNPGLASRIPYQLHFPDYTTEELLSIARFIAAEYDYELSTGYQKELLHRFFREKQKLNFSNGRYVRNFIENSIRKQNSRLARSRGFRSEDLNLLREEDL